MHILCDPVDPNSEIGHGKVRGGIGQNHARRYRPVLKIGFWLLMSLSQCLPAGAGEAARVSGTVFTIGADRVRNVWPNVRITLKNLANAIKSTTVSDSLGEYFFGDVMPGKYEIRVDLAAFRTAARQTTLPEKGDVRVDFQLDPGIPDKTVEVTADAVAVDVSSSSGCVRDLYPRPSAPPRYKTWREIGLCHAVPT
jgi:hypothetical protein